MDSPSCASSLIDPLEWERECLRKAPPLSCVVPLLVEQVRDRRSEADVQVRTDVRQCVLGTYAERTQDGVSRPGHPHKVGLPFQQRFFSWTFLSTCLVSQFAPFPQISRIVRELPPVSIHAETSSNVSDWRVGAKFSLSFQVHHYESQLVRNRLVPPPCLGIPSP